ncbi:hypothetical protein B0T20DRAFT_199496 [Sordaria brevicollis]|uniref:DUF1308 domain-containing protein n=1 Tax=Sordaria brevicollis TaxID=83679 RepID=A0AAE0PGN1_SORBR|nr:hypothetical protein B0T20DRAFT_199496 [Sordaria brevicollis]
MTAHDSTEGGALLSNGNGHTTPPTTTTTKPKYHEHKGEPLEGAALEECIESLIQEWTTCVHELTQLHTYAESSSKPIRGLYSLLKVQQRTLDKLKAKREALPIPTVSNDDDDAEDNEPKPLFTPAQYFGMRSCCWDDRWSVVKKCRGLVAINKEFARSPKQPVAEGKGWLAYKDKPLLERPVAVDAVIDSGATWLKFVSISPKTLAYQIAVDGWESEEEEEAAYSDEEGGYNGNGTTRNGVSEALGNTDFAESVKKVILAARWNHCHHVHLLLPGLRDGESEPVDRMLRYIRERIGGDDVSVTVSCADSPLLADAPPPLDTALSALIDERDPLVADDCGRITPTANLDPSVLVSLVTDLHHGLVDLLPDFQQKVIARSVSDHKTDSNELVPREDILAKVLYPALRGKKLVTTRLAARYFRQLIASISTHSEEVRASFILPPDAPPALLSPGDTREPLSTAHLTPAQRRAELQRWSAIPVPEDLHLPIEIVEDIDLDEVPSLIEQGKLPPMALGVAKDLSQLNRSVYLHGWVNRLTTVTGHRGIERQIRLSLATHWTPPPPDSSSYTSRSHTSSEGNNEIPPDIWHRHLGGYLIHRDKPRDWKALIAEYEGCENGRIPDEVVKWTNPWTTWGRGISTYGLPDTKTWEGVGHADKTSFGRKLQTREERGQRNPGRRDSNGDGEDGEEDMEEDIEEEGEEEQS